MDSDKQTEEPHFMFAKYSELTQGSSIVFLMRAQCCLHIVIINKCNVAGIPFECIHKGV